MAMEKAVKLTGGRRLKKIKLLLLILTMVMMSVVGYAETIYPETMNNGNLVLVDGGMGVGKYVDRSSVSVQRYEPPYYQIAINIVNIRFSDDYWSQHGTYVGGPYKISKEYTALFRYNWNRKLVSHQHHDGIWRDWDINKNHSHADGDPFVPYAAETAFVSAYNMRFYNNTMGYSPISKGKYRVISEAFYRKLGL